MVSKNSKILKEIKSVAVHDGSFHPDDVFSVAILQMIYPKIKIVRTRDEKLLKKVTARVDVGLKYNPKTLDFDHHQSDGPQRDTGLPYASVGLVWRHFGMHLIDTDDEFKYIDDKLIKGIDAEDNGIKIVENIGKVSSYTLYQIIYSFNPHWTDRTKNYDKSFLKAVKFAKTVLKSEIKYAKSQKDAIKILQSAVNNSKGDYVVLSKSCPWKHFLVEKSNKKYVIYHNSANESWYVSGVPIKMDSFQIRKNFPKTWAGLTGKDLVKVTGVKTAVFCHKNLFLCATKTKEDAIKIAEIALKSK